MNKHSVLSRILMIITILMHLIINYRIQSAIFENLVWYYDITRNWAEIKAIYMYLIIDILISFVAAKTLPRIYKREIAQLADISIAIIMLLILVIMILKDVVFTMRFDNYSLQLFLMILADSIVCIERFIIAHIPIYSTVQSALKKVKSWI